MGMCYPQNSTQASQVEINLNETTPKSNTNNFTFYAMSNTSSHITTNSPMNINTYKQGPIYRKILSKKSNFHIKDRLYVY